MRRRFDCRISEVEMKHFSDESFFCKSACKATGGARGLSWTILCNMHVAYAMRKQSGLSNRALTGCDCQHFFFEIHLVGLVGPIQSQASNELSVKSNLDTTTVSDDSLI